MRRVRPVATPVVRSTAPRCGIFDRGLQLDDELVMRAPLTVEGIAVVILALGMVAVFLVAAPLYVGIPVQVVTWSLARFDLQEMKTGIRDPAGKTLTQLGQLLAIIGLAISIFISIARIF